MVAGVAWSRKVRADGKRRSNHATHGVVQDVRLRDPAIIEDREHIGGKQIGAVGRRVSLAVALTMGAHVGHDQLEAFP